MKTGFTQLIQLIFHRIVLGDIMSYHSGEVRRGEYWLLFFLKGLSNQSLEAISRIDRLGQLRTAYQKRLYSECYSIWDIWGINDYNMNP